MSSVHNFSHHVYIASKGPIDEQFSLIQSVCAALFVCAATAYLLSFLKSDKDPNRIKGIPGPVAGDKIYDAVKRTRHHGMVKAHEKFGELVQFPQPTGPILYMRGSETDINRFFKDRDIFGKNAGTFEHLGGAVDVVNLVQPMLVDTIFEWEGKKWQDARKDINPFFTHPEVYNSTIRAVELFLKEAFASDPAGVDEQKDDEDVRAESRWTGDLLAQVHTMIKMCVVEIMGGYQMDEDDTRVLDEIIDHFISRNMSEESFDAPTMNLEDADVFKRILTFSHKVLSYTKKNIDNMSPKALLVLMIKSGNYTDDQMVALFVNLLVAGGETPALAACKTLCAMVRDPEVMRMAVAEVDDSFAAAGANSLDAPLTEEVLEKLKYVECCVMEGLRRFAPATVVGRCTMVDTELCGYKVPKGTSVQVSIHAVHMNPKVWPQPEKFDPLRFDTKACAAGHPTACTGDVRKNMIAFGLGTRACPGKAQYIRMCKAIIGGIIRRCTVEVPDKVDLDSFLPNRFVAWDVKGINLTLKSRDPNVGGAVEP